MISTNKLSKTYLETAKDARCNKIISISIFFAILACMILTNIYHVKYERLNIVLTEETNTTFIDNNQTGFIENKTISDSIFTENDIATHSTKTITTKTTQDPDITKIFVKKYKRKTDELINVSYLMYIMLLNLPIIFTLFALSSNISKYARIEEEYRSKQSNTDIQEKLVEMTHNLVNTDEKTITDLKGEKNKLNPTQDKKRLEEIEKDLQNTKKSKEKYQDSYLLAMKALLETSKINPAEKMYD